MLEKVLFKFNQKFAAALVVPDFENMQLWCKNNDVPYTNEKEMVKNAKIKKRYWEEINLLNKNFGGSEKIKSFELIDHEWSVDTGELTASLKLKRNEITEKYKDIIEDIFS